MKILTLDPLGWELHTDRAGSCYVVSPDGIPQALLAGQKSDWNAKIREFLKTPEAHWCRTFDKAIIEAATLAEEVTR